MSLEKSPPSRYRVEEKNGLLIVHDSMAGGQVTSAAPTPMPRSALGGANLPLSVSPSLASPSSPTPASSAPASLAIGVNRITGSPVDSGKAKRGATVAAAGIGLVFFLIITGLWPIMAIAMLVAPMRKRLLAGALPAVKRYIEEGKV